MKSLPQEILQGRSLPRMPKADINALKEVLRPIQMNSNWVCISEDTLDLLKRLCNGHVVFFVREGVDGLIGNQAPTVPIWMKFEPETMVVLPFSQLKWTLGLQLHKFCCKCIL